MSVPKSKRGNSELTVITKATALASYTVHICSNEKCFPKRYRWCITAKIVDASVDILRYANMANSIRVVDAEDYKLRRNYQTRVLANTYSLLSMMDLAYQSFGIDGNRMEYWTGLVIEVQNLLRAWRKSDKERYEHIG